MTEAAGGAQGLASITLDPQAPTPLYHQIYLAIRERIRLGALATGELIPGEQELARLFGISRITVKRALNELSADGLVTRHRGRGSFVSGRSPPPMVKGSFDNLIESLHLMGLETEVEVLEVADVQAEGAVAARLGVETGAPLQRAVRRRKLAGEPFSYLITWVPADIARRYSREDLAATPLLVLLERGGAAATEAEQWITAVAADPPMAASLDVALGAPLLKIERVMRDAKGRAVQVIDGFYRPDRFQYHLRTVRKRSSGGGDWRSDS